MGDLPEFAGTMAVAGDGRPVAPVVSVEYYTDPLCCWSWVFEGAWRRLRFAYGPRLAWTLRLGGMIPSWEAFRDPVHAIHGPGQMAPHWYHASHVSGVPMDERVWRESPPASSWPASLAVKAAGLQGDRHAAHYLRRVREAVMLERRDVSRRDILVELARDLSDVPAAGDPGLDVERFEQDLGGPDARRAFEDDLRECAYRNVRRFPALVVRRPGARTLLLLGSRPFDAVQAAIVSMAPELDPLDPPRDVVAYAAAWRRVTIPEMAVGLGLEPPEAAKQVRDAVAAGRLEQWGAEPFALFSAPDAATTAAEVAVSRGAGRRSG